MTKSYTTTKNSNKQVEIITNINSNTGVRSIQDNQATRKPDSSPNNSNYSNNPINSLTYTHNYSEYLTDSNIKTSIYLSEQNSSKKRTTLSESIMNSNSTQSGLAFNLTLYENSTTTLNPTFNISISNIFVVDSTTFNSSSLDANLNLTTLMNSPTIQENATSIPILNTTLLINISNNTGLIPQNTSSMNNITNMPSLYTTDLNSITDILTNLSTQYETSNLTTYKQSIMNETYTTLPFMNMSAIASSNSDTNISTVFSQNSTLKTSITTERRFNLTLIF